MRAPRNPLRPYNRTRLRLSSHVFDLSDGSVQLGDDERWLTRLSGLTESEVAWLTGLVERRHVTPTDQAALCGVEPTRGADLLEVLIKAGHAISLPMGLPGGRICASGGGRADMEALAASTDSGCGAPTQQRRAASSVAISSSCRLGTAIAVLLATAGVGRLVLPDLTPVLVTDLGLGGHQPCDVGRTRLSSARDAVRRATAEAVVVEDGPADVVVMIEPHAANPMRHLRLMGEGVPHLIVEAGLTRVVVGPLVSPGNSPCSRCVDLSRADGDAAWSAIAAGQHARGPSPVEATLAATAAAAAGAQVLAQIDGLRPVTSSAQLRLAYPQPVAEPLPLSFHPDCGCRALPARRPGN